MMSEQRVAPALAPLLVPAIGTDRRPLSVARRPMRPVFLVLDIATDTDLACLPSRGTTFCLCTGHRFA